MYIRLPIALLVTLLFTIVCSTEAQTTHDAQASVAGSAHDNVASKKDESAVKSESPKKEEKAIADIKPLKNLPSDVRVLIDVSGSMKKTDPQNLRKPALDLIVRLLPDKSRAGIWTFGNSTNMLMPHRVVDDAWRKQAAPKASQINSIALFTNIGKALEEVIFDKKNLSPDYKTHIILLTDGVVDISKEAVDNMKERQRILTEILPDLKASGYTVHTIALSADADADLMKKISVATDGISTIAHSADELMSTFLKIFDQAVPAERLPLENNGFLVDASVKEFTALIFRKADVERTVIISPEGKEFSATSPQDGINWYHTDKYDLITADTPKAGQWKIKTDIAPQSRVTVVSNLQLSVQPLKNNLRINDPLAISYSFQENGKTVVSKEFLGLLEANAIIAKDGTEENTPLSFTTTSPPDDGVYHQTINAFTEAGDYEIHVYVDGKTFKREFKHSLNVRGSTLVLAKEKVNDDAGKLTYRYKISVDEKLVDVKKSQVSISITNSKNNNVEKILVLQEPNHWDFSFVPADEAEYTVKIHGEGELLDGSKFDETLTADQFIYTKVAKPEEKIEPEKKADVPPPEEKPIENKNNLLLYIGIGIANLIVVILAFFAYRMFMGSKAKDEFAEIEKTLATHTADKKPGDSKKSQEKTEIDLSEADSAHIPVNEDDNMDNLFPLDNMEEPGNNDKP